MSDTSLSRAYALTRSIAEATEAGDWLGAARLVDERSPFIRAIGKEQSEEGLALVREIQRLDAAVMQRAGGARDMVTTRFNEAQRRVAAASFYQKTGQLR